MRTQKAIIRIILLVISIISCVLPQAQGQSKGGLVNVIATPITICEGGSSYLHASYLNAEPILYDFEDGMQGWTTIDADGHGQAWLWYNYDSYSGSHCMAARYNSSYAHQDYLVSPRITLGIGKISFYAKDGSSYWQDPFRVYLSTTGNTSVADFNIELTNGNVYPGTTYTKYEYDLSSYQGEGYIAIVYTAAANQYYLYVDDITIYDNGSSALNGTTYTFENGTLQSWTRIDADGDGNNWKIGTSSDSYYSLSIPGHNNSNHCVYSESYVCTNISYDYENYMYHFEGDAVTPNNYLVSPTKIAIQNGAFISFWACGVSQWPSEHFGVAVSSANNPTSSSFSTIREWTMPNSETTYLGWPRQGVWYQYTVDLSAYAGQSIWVAIRHFNCNDQFYLAIDDITIYEGSASSGSDNITYHWTPGNMSGADITVTPSQTTTYTVTAYQDGSSNPIGSASQTVVVEPVPEVGITTSTGEASICEDDSITLYASVSGTDYHLPGDILCTDGSIVHPSDWPNGKTAKAIVFYVDATGQQGWAIDLGQNVQEPKKWSIENNNVSVPGLTFYGNFIEAISDMDGYSNTQKIRNCNDDPLKYPAAWAVDFDQGWYLPSIGQLNILFGVYFAVKIGLEAVGGTTIYEGDLWSSSASTSAESWMIRIGNGYVGTEPKTGINKVRAVINF